MRSEPPHAAASEVAQPEAEAAQKPKRIWHGTAGLQEIALLLWLPIYNRLFALEYDENERECGGSGFEPIPEPPWRTREMRSPDDTSEAMSSSPLSPASGWRRKRLRRPSPHYNHFRRRS